MFFKRNKADLFCYLHLFTGISQTALNIEFTNATTVLKQPFVEEK